MKGESTRYKWLRRMNRQHRPEDLPELIREMRSNLHLSQEDFARILDVRQATVSVWETGEENPSCGSLVKLGNLAHDRDAIWLWQLAGIETDKLIAAVGLLLRDGGVPPTQAQESRIPDLAELPVRVPPETAMRILQIDGPELLKLIAAGKVKGRRFGSADFHLIELQSVMDHLASRKRKP